MDNENSNKGRPSLYTEELADYICGEISRGITLSQICREDGMPNRRTVGLWREKDEAFNSRFARAREIGFDEIAEEALDIADDGSNDWMERNGEKSEGWQLNGEHVQRSKLRIETRLKLLAKWDPKRYGERLDLTSKGEALPSSTIILTDKEAQDISKALEDDV